MLTDSKPVIFRKMSQSNDSVVAFGEKAETAMEPKGCTEVIGAKGQSPKVKLEQRAPKMKTESAPRKRQPASQHTASETKLGTELVDKSQKVSVQETQKEEQCLDNAVVTTAKFVQESEPLRGRKGAEKGDEEDIALEQYPELCEKLEEILSERNARIIKLEYEVGKLREARSKSAEIAQWMVKEVKAYKSRCENERERRDLKELQQRKIELKNERQQSLGAKTKAESTQAEYDSPCSTKRTLDLEAGQKNEQIRKLGDQLEKTDGMTDGIR